MDKKILKWGRQILQHTPTFPAAILSSPHLLQLPMPSDSIQTSQLRCFWRSQHRGPRQAAVTNRLLQRALHQQANYTTNPQAVAPLQSNPTQPGQGPLWAHTIAKSMLTRDSPSVNLPLQIQPDHPASSTPARHSPL
jgi:hypothetical protein